MRLKCLWLLLVVLLNLLPGVGWTANETDTDTVQLIRKRIGDISTAFVLRGCTPTPAGLSLAAFACEGNVLDAGYSIPVVQAAEAVGPLTAGDGTYWVALAKDRTSPVDDWTRQTGTHYLWRLSTTEPGAVPGVLLFARVIVTGGAITQVGLIGNRNATGGETNATALGVICDGVTPTATTLQAVLDTVPRGTAVVLPAGVCVLQAGVTIPRPLTLKGAGMNKTTLRQTVSTLPVLTVASLDVTISSLTVSHTGTPVAGGDGLVVAPGFNHIYLDNLAANYNFRGFVLGSVAYGNGDHLEAAANNSHGFEFSYAGSGACQWDISDSVSQLNKGAGFGGFNTVAANGIGPFLSKTTSFGNNQGGYVFNGSPGFPINDLRLADVLSSADNLGGIYLDTFGFGHLISNPWIELTGVLGGFPLGSDGALSVASNSGHCFAITSNAVYGVAITGGLYAGCSWSGIAIDAPYSTITGGTTIGNGKALDPLLSRRAGIHIGGNGVIVSGHSFQYLHAPATLHYVHLGNVLEQVSLGLNMYAPGIASSQIVHGSEAIFTSFNPAAMVTGASVYTNRADAPGLLLVDALNGANPQKILRVSNGNFEIINAAATAVISRVSNEGTPSWPARRGQATIADTNSTANVVLTPSEADATYFVQLTLTGMVGTPPLGALTVNSVFKAPGAFDISIAAVPGAGQSVTYDWLVYR